ncbi:ABC transporter permease [Nocardioides iriomotensis]|uniref:ABC transporter permease n=1 Tax=Nocardioides iriomotensis TaxID=715784 RepID=A0A4Q5IXT6_9ACTN|nr:ABC transporter permease [Nocardioides iriomotensis]RYU10803.1 ABC transporter permease [Nocardioides iriomotensis]
MGYFLRRTGFFVATLWAAVTLNFLIPRLQPGDPAEAIVSRLTGKSEAVDPRQVEAIRRLLGTPDGSLLTQYWDYLGELVHGNFGLSYTYFPYTVTEVIGDAALWTVVLVGVTQILSFVIGTLLGAWAAYRRNSRVDSVITLGSTFVGTLPFFWIALLLIYVFAITLQWFPDGGGYGGGSTPGWSWLFFSDAFQHSVLPALSLLITGPIGWIIGMRNNMVQELGQDYARLARAKGLPQRRIALTYGARIAILPNVTGFAIALGSILGGTVLVETIFNYPGLGRLLLESVSNKDFPLMQALFLFTTIGVLVANFVADLLYGVLDPRVRRTEAA